MEGRAALQVLLRFGVCDLCELTPAVALLPLLLLELLPFLVLFLRGAVSNGDDEQQRGKREEENGEIAIILFHEEQIEFFLPPFVFVLVFLFLFLSASLSPSPSFLSLCL